MQNDPTLHLRVILRHLESKQLDRSTVHHGHSGGGIRRPFTREQRDFPREELDSQPSHERNFHREFIREEARPDGHIDPTRLDRVQERSEFRRIVLAVAIDSRDIVVPHLPSELEAGLDRSANTEVEWIGDRKRTGPLRDGRRVVNRSIVDDEDVGIG